MKLNTSIYALSGQNYANSALFTLSLRSVAQNLRISSVYYQRSFSPFFRSSNTNFNLEISGSHFKKFLSSTVKVVADKYALLDTRSRVVFSRKYDIFMNDCSFTECSAQGLGVDGHGGAICVFVPPEGLFDLNLERINFHKCYAKSSGGSIFSMNKVFKSAVVCFSESFAAKNIIAYIQANQLIMNNTYAGSNSFFDEFNPCTTTFGFRGESLTIQEVNMSNTRVDMGSSCFALHGYNNLIASYTIYQNSISENAIYAHSIGHPTTLLQRSMLVNNSFSDYLIIADVPISFFQVGFDINLTLGFIETNQSELFTMKSCYLNGKEEDWKNLLTSFKFEELTYGADINLHTRISLYDAHAGCRDHEMNFKYKKDPDAVKEDLSPPTFVKLAVKLAPSIVGLILVCAIFFYILRKKRRIVQKPPPIFGH